MDAHESALAHASEIIRQELVSIGTIASNYTEEARKASITLTTIYTYVKHLLDTRDVTDTDPPSQTDIKEVPSAEEATHHQTTLPNSRTS
jgi:DNA invertase Pin-like site-specific DNA recombinase